MENLVIIIASVAILLVIAGFVLLLLFKNIAQQVLEERSRIFDQQAEQKLSTTLEPFRRDMEHLRESVQQSSRERFSLKEQIEHIGAQANNLAQALTSRPQMRGHWGEIILKKMLDDAGLRENKDYHIQQSIRDEENRLLRPDIVIHLPENKNLVIDSKLSLVSYEQYFSEPDEDLQKAHLKQFLDATKKHIDDLAGKQYHHARQLQAPDFTILFMPIEGAYLVAMGARTNLHQYAWDRKIVIVSPPTLFAMLQTIASLWRLDKQNKHADEIAEQGGKLYDKVAAFVEDMEKLGRHIHTAQESYENTMKKLNTGRGNIITHTEKLKELGARTSKQLPDAE